MKTESKNFFSDTDQKPISCLCSIYFLNEEAKCEFLQNCRFLKQGNLIYKTDNKKRDKTYDFQKFKRIKSFGGEILMIIYP